jgi:peptidoglycan/xylan/chitin deacetylase (PgdA/CDA1 family)
MLIPEIKILENFMRFKYLFFIMILKFNFLFSQQSIADFSYSLSNFKDNLTTAVSITFDDNSKGQFNVAMPILEKYNIPGTFFVITSAVNDSLWAKMPEMIRHGHEIGSHSVTHPHFSQIIDSAIDTELSLSKTKIEDKIPGYHCISFANPFGDYTTYSLKAEQKYYLSARLLGGSNIVPIDNYYKITGDPVLDSTDYATAINKYDIYKAKDRWFIMVIHGVDNDGGYYPINSIYIENYCKFINSKRDSTWIATYGDVVKYTLLRENTKFNIIKTTDKSLTASLTTTLDTGFYNFPECVRLNVPKEWQKITITQNDSLLKYNINYSTKNNLLVFNARPNGGIMEVYADSIAPVPLVLSSPLNGSIEGVTNLILSWDKTFLAKSYSLEVSTVPDFSKKIYSEKGISTFYKKITGLPNNTKFYWRISSTIIGGIHEWSDTWNFSTHLFTSINKVKINDKIKIYPNPTNSLVYIYSNEINLANYTVELFNYQGIELPLFVNQISNVQDQIDLSGYPPGIYLILMNSRNESYLSRVIKK